MRYISAQPAILYYAWQIDIMIYSFINNGVKQDQIDIILADNNENCNYYNKLKDKYKDVNFYYYPDTREDKFYVSSIRPHILKKHFVKFPELYKGAFLYHDCDIALTRPLDLKEYLDDEICYLSDTKSYIGYNYIVSKGEAVLDRMLHCFDLDKKTVKDNEENSGGAQYLLKNIDYKFWENVEKDCVQLYKNIHQMNKKLKVLDENYHELQIWCADMWAVLWNLWIEKKQTKIIKEMDFIWATDPKEFWTRKAIFHNAGVTNTKNKLFYKGNWLSEVPPKNLDINIDKSSYNYYQLLIEAL